MVRVGLALAAADIAVSDDLLVLQVLRLQPGGDLDPAQVAALSALPPSVVASSLDRLVRSGLARDALVDGRVRFGLP
jgi:DNA-binding IclR family transcriptional regulator